MTTVDLAAKSRSLPSAARVNLDGTTGQYVCGSGWVASRQTGLTLTTTPHTEGANAPSEHSHLRFRIHLLLLHMVVYYVEVVGNSNKYWKGLTQVENSGRGVAAADGSRRSDLNMSEGGPR
jgi:hypothetical protein